MAERSWTPAELVALRACNALCEHARGFRYTTCAAAMLERGFARSAESCKSKLIELGAATSRGSPSPARRAASPAPAPAHSRPASSPAPAQSPAPRSRPHAAVVAASADDAVAAPALSPLSLSWVQLLLLLGAAALFCAGLDVRFLASFRDALRPFDSQLVALSTLSNARLQSGIMMTVYVAQYCALGGLFEATHPEGALSSGLSETRLAQRRRQVASEVLTGVVSLAVTVVIAVLWMWKVEPSLWTFGFFATHEWTPAWALLGLLAYIAAFDTHFFWSHWLLHESTFLWNSVHYYHHSYKLPTAFAQFAVHPLEAAIQGPFGHFFVQLFCPVHPAQLALMGFLSSAWAFAAHDGRGLDINSHFMHHSKGRGRKFYFNLGFLTPFWDIVMGTRWHEQHPLWIEWKKGASKTAFDTLDGTADSTSNDTFGSLKGRRA